MGGYCWASGTQYVVIDDCVNTGTIHCLKISSEIFGYTNSDKTTIRNCVGAGKIVLDDGGQLPSFIGFSSANPDNYTLTGNKLVENDGTQYFTYSITSGKEANIVELKNAPAERVAVVSSSDANAAITAIGKVGASNPGASGTLGYVAPGTAVVTPGTGDTALIVMIIAAVSLLGMGIALKARKA